MSAAMKRTTLIPSLLISIVFVFLSASVAASPLADGATSFDVSLAPGSIIQFDHLTIEDGLSQNAGLAIFQDSRGFLWVGSQDGLNRYDGYTFKIFKHDPDDPTSISHNSILSITEDNEGYLWIGTWGGGLNRFDPITETFVRYRHDPEEPTSLSNNVVTSIKEDSRGVLWVGTLGGLNRYRPEQEAFDHFTHDPANPNSLSSNAISLVFEDSLAQLWIGTGAFGIEGSGLNRFDPATGKAVHYRHDDLDPASLASNNISAIYESQDGSLWIATGGFSLRGAGLDQFDPRTGKAQHFANNPQIADSLSTNDLMTLW